MDWRVLAVTAPVLFVSYQSLSKLLPKGTSSFLVNAYASLVGVIVMLALHLLTQSDKSVQLPSRTLLIVLGMGLFISFGNFGIIKSYALGAPQAAFTPLFYITLIIYGIFFGFLIFHEKLQPLQLVGIIVAIGGIYLATKKS